MPEPPFVKLFGSPGFHPTGDIPALKFTPERPYQILALLASRARWVRRDELGTMLWPDRDTGQARSNLRKVLLLARKLAHLTEIEQRGDELRWSPKSDVSEFETAWLGGDFDAAASIGGEPFLHGMETGLPDASRDWILVERRRLEERWRAACLRCLQVVGVDSPKALAISTLLLKRDPLDETATLALARAHAARGDKDPALAVLNEYADRIRRELSVEPSPEWKRAVDAIEGVQVKAMRATPPKAETFLIGRRAELGQIARLLEEPACRVLTLVGLAGMGKSALAHAVLAGALDKLPDSAVWIALSDLTSAREVPLRLATSLGIALAGHREPWPQVHRSLAERSLLIILDNAEHLELVEALEDWLTACPGIKILATSRTRLGVVGEWLLPVDGLPLPDEDEDDVEVLQRCDAILLFEARVQPFMPGFDIAGQQSAACRLVRLLGGSPLAIALAAARARVMSVADIVTELAESIEKLDSVAADERGLRSGLEQAWQLLTPLEQQAVARIACMPGEFGRAMAGEVGKVSLPALASLVDKAFLRAEGAGRFSMHALIRQWAARHVGDSEDVLAAHAAYVGRWLGQYASPLADLPSAAVMAEIDREIAHVRVASQHAVARAHDELVASFSRALSTYFDRRGMWKEGLSLFEEAVAVLERDAGERHASMPGPGLAAALRALGVLQFRNGQLLEAEASARKLRDIAVTRADLHLEKSAFQMIGLATWQQGRLDAAREAMARALCLANETGDLRSRSNFLGNLAMIDNVLGRHDDALCGYTEVLALNRESGTAETVVSTLGNLAHLHRSLAQYDDALARLNEALGICNKSGLRSTRPYLLLNFAEVHEELGNLSAAADYIARATAEARSHGTPRVECDALLLQGRLDLAAGRTEAAREKTAYAMTIADQMSDATTQIACVFNYGEIMAAEGNLVLGVTLMRWAVAQPAFGASDQRVARRLATFSSTIEEIAAETPLGQVLAMLPARQVRPRNAHETPPP